MPDPTFDELLSAYLDGETSPAERELVERLLESTDPIIVQETKRRLDALARVSDALRSLPIEPAPVELAPSIRQRAEREQLLASLPPAIAGTSEPSSAASLTPAVAASTALAAEASPPTVAGSRRWTTWIAVVGSLAATACAVMLAIRPLMRDHGRHEASPATTMARAERPESIHGWHDSVSGDTFDTSTRDHLPFDESPRNGARPGMATNDRLGANPKALNDGELAFSKGVADPVAREREAAASLAAGSAPRRAPASADAMLRDASRSQTASSEVTNTFRKKSGESAKPLPESLANTSAGARASFQNQPMGAGGMGGGAGGPGSPGRVASGRNMSRPNAPAEAGAVEAQAENSAPYGLVANNAPGGFIVPPRVGIGQIVPYFSNVEGKIAVIEMQVLDFEEAVGGFRVLLQENGVASVDTSEAMGDTDGEIRQRLDADVQDRSPADFSDAWGGERRKTKLLFAPADRKSLADVKKREADHTAAATAPVRPVNDAAEGAAFEKNQKQLPATEPAVAGRNPRPTAADGTREAGEARPRTPETYVLYVDAAPEQIIAAYTQLISVGNGAVGNGIFRTPVAFDESTDEGLPSDRDAAKDAPAPDSTRIATAGQGKPSVKDENRSAPQAKQGSKADAKNESGSGSQPGNGPMDGKPADSRLANGQDGKEWLRQLESREAGDDLNASLSPSQEQEVVSRLSRLYRARSLQENSGEWEKAESERISRRSGDTSGKAGSGNGQEPASKSDAYSKSDGAEKPRPAPVVAPAPPSAPAVKSPQPPLGGANGNGKSKPSPQASPESGEAKKEFKSVTPNNPRGATKPAEEKAPAPTSRPIIALPAEQEMKPQSRLGEESARPQGIDRFFSGPAVAEIPGEPLPAVRSFQYGFRVPVNQEMAGDKLNLPSKDASGLASGPQENSDPVKGYKPGRKGDNVLDEQSFNLPKGAPAGSGNVGRYGNAGLKPTGGPAAADEKEGFRNREENLPAKALGLKVTPPSDKTTETATPVPAPSVKVLFVFQRVPVPAAAPAEPAASSATPAAGGK